MADTLNNKTKLTLNAGFAKPRPASPGTPTKLLINHGKPNFTIQRSPKIDEPRKFATPSVNNNSERNVVTHTKFFGVLNSVNKMSKEQKVEIPTTLETDSPKVTLRRTPTIPPLKRNEGDENVPEFILRQRAIQQRLAKDNSLDFENRRSGYFTQVVLSPTSPTPTIFAETMSSPAVNPALEIPAPELESHTEVEAQKVAEKPIEPAHQQLDDEEVANAIEEVNRAIAGEDIDTQHTTENEHLVEEKVQTETEHTLNGHVEVQEAPIVEHVNGHVEEKEAPIEVKPEISMEHVNGHIEVKHENSVEHVNGHGIDENNNDDDITISHTNSYVGPHIPAPDPSGELGVNYEPKTVVSFSKDLGLGENKYPDTVVVTTYVNSADDLDPKLQELSKLKFDITTDDQQDIQVVPVRAE